MVRALYLLLFLLVSLVTVSQTKVITGFIKDSHSEEPIPFASVQLKKSGIGKLADSAGRFFLSGSPEN
jgi:hypothetical protein